MNNKIKHLTAYQLVVGMKIRCPFNGDEIIISDLIAHSETSFSLLCKKGGASFNIHDTFELIEPFDLTKCNLNWINDEITEVNVQYDLDRTLDFIFGTEDHFDKAEIEIIPYVLNGISYELIENTETIILTKDSFQSFFTALKNKREAVDMIVIMGELQNHSQRLDGTPILSSLITLHDFSKTIQPLLNSNQTKTIDHWRDCGCQFINIDFLQKSFKR
ncbi:hypothetical protein ACN08N_00155 (plasmid) [Photobacterium leiognathi subsp. mandapamensis]|uniref:hypothetical protein n=1 Tax=Photobacterium leiognathi TaxID=553611 RepID=UPI003AF3A688